MKAKYLVYEGLGFPVIMIGFKTKKVRDEVLPDVNMKQLQAMVFEALTVKPSTLSGSELLFIRSYLGLTQSEFALKIGLSNHSRISQWEKKSLKSAGMEYVTELSVRLVMAATIRDGLIAKVYRALSEHRPEKESDPVKILSTAA